MIQELLDSNTMVSLFTRPRRFGKTLNMSMLRRFEDERKSGRLRRQTTGISLKALHFSVRKRISGHQQQYPVINLSLKSAKQPDFEMAYKSLIDEIAGEFRGTQVRS